MFSFSTSINRANCPTNLSEYTSTKFRDILEYICLLVVFACMAHEGFELNVWWHRSLLYSCLLAIFCQLSPHFCYLVISIVYFQICSSLIHQMTRIWFKYLCKYIWECIVISWIIHPLPRQFEHSHGLGGEPPWRTFIICPMHRSLFAVWALWWLYNAILPNNV